MDDKLFSRSGLYLWFAATISAVAVLPYVFSLTPHALDEAVAKTGMPMLVLASLSIVQSAVLLGFMTFAGLWAARKFGSGAPLLDAYLRGEGWPAGLGGAALKVAALGFASGMLLIALDLFAFMPLAPVGLVTSLPAPPPRWMGLLASLYGGVGEEIQLRLFLLSFLALGLRYLSRLVVRAPHAVSGVPGTVSAPVFWSANLLAALLFGLGHLPATAEIMPLIPLVIVRAIVLNGIVGVVAGYLFWRRGIEAAMLYHFAADIALHVVFRTG